jgi:hypothetical protein
VGLIRHCSPPLRWPLARYGRITFLLLALQLRFLPTSESMGNHDSKIVDAGSVD